MAKSLLVFVMAAAAFLAVVLPTTDALKCFHCNDCGDDAGTPYDCTGQNDVCLKIDIAGLVKKSCAQKVACGLGGVERGVVNAWNYVKNLLSDVDQDVVDIPDDAKANAVKCCEDDLCNSAPSKTASSLIYILPLAIACFFRL